MGLFNAIINVFEMIYEEGLKEWLEESQYMEALDELYNELEMGKITEEEYEGLEAGILDQLKAVRKYKKENDM